MRKLWVTVVVGVLVVGLEVSATQPTFEETSGHIREQSATAVKILTPPVGQPNTDGVGTGVIMGIVDSTMKYYLITNKHVLTGFDTVRIIVQIVDSEVVPVKTDTSTVSLFDNSGKTRVITADGDLDIAAVRVKLPVHRKGIEFVRVAGEHAVAHLSDIFVGQDVLFDGFPLNVTPNGTQPLIRQGMVAGIDTLKQVVYLDTQAFPGSSGSPVFMDPRNVIKGGPVFIGIIASYIPFRKFLVNPQTGEPEMMQTENSGIAYVMPAWQIEKMIQKAKSR